jgi:hypothetical protein
MRATIRALCAVALALGGAACGAGHRHPGARGPQAAAVVQANATHEYPGPAPPAERAGGAPGPTQAVAAFARAYINWNASDVAATMARLARASIGQARSEMTLAAAEVRADTTLSQGEIANRGSVEAVARLAGTPNGYVVVTRESTTSGVSSAYQGLAPAWHLTLATVTEQRTSAGVRWVVSGWQPEN